MAGTKPGHDDSGRGRIAGGADPVGAFGPDTDAIGREVAFDHPVQSHQSNGLALDS